MTSLRLGNSGPCVQETIGIIKKLMAENISSAILTMERLLSDAAIKSAMGDTRLALLGARGLVNAVGLGKRKLALLTRLVTDLKVGPRGGAGAAPNASSIS